MMRYTFYKYSNELKIFRKIFHLLKDFYDKMSRCQNFRQTEKLRTTLSFTSYEEF